MGLAQRILVAWLLVIPVLGTAQAFNDSLMSLRLWEELELTLNERTDASKWKVNSFGSAWCREHRQKFPRLELTSIGDWPFEPVTGEWRDGMIAEAQLEHLEFDELRSYGVTTWIRLPEQSISYRTIARAAVRGRPGLAAWMSDVEPSDWALVGVCSYYDPNDNHVELAVVECQPIRYFNDSLMNLRLFEELVDYTRQHSDTFDIRYSEVGSKLISQGGIDFILEHGLVHRDPYLKLVLEEQKDLILIDVGIDNPEEYSLVEMANLARIGIAGNESYRTIARDAVNAWLNSKGHCGLIENNEKKGTVIFGISSVYNQQARSVDIVLSHWTLYGGAGVSPD